MSLQLARLLLEAMGGTLVIERAPLGKGSRVTVRLPIVSLPPTSPAVERAAPRTR